MSIDRIMAIGRIIVSQSTPNSINHALLAMNDSWSSFIPPKSHNVFTLSIPFAHNVSIHDGSGVRPPTKQSPHQASPCPGRGRGGSQAKARTTGDFLHLVHHLHKLLFGRPGDCLCASDLQRPAAGPGHGIMVLILSPHCCLG